MSRGTTIFLLQPSSLLKQASSDFLHLKAQASLPFPDTLVALTAPRPSWGATTDCLQAWLSPQMLPYLDATLQLLICLCLLFCVVGCQTQVLGQARQELYQ